MPLHRRDFMKLMGISVASLFLNRCRSQSAETIPTPACYEPTEPPRITVTPAIASPRERLRLYWLRFDELAQRSPEDTENTFGDQLIAGHRNELNELIAAGEISASAADLVQEAYNAAVYHVWRSNAPITCYEPAMIDYAPQSAGTLIAQSQTLNKIAAEGAVNPDTLAKAQMALEHDLSFYALNEEDIQALYSQIQREYDPGKEPPSFEELPLELTPEAQEAAQFIIDLLTGK